MLARINVKKAHLHMFIIMRGAKVTNLVTILGTIGIYNDILTEKNVRVISFGPPDFQCWAASHSRYTFFSFYPPAVAKGLTTATTFNQWSERFDHIAGMQACILCKCL